MFRRSTILFVLIITVSAGLFAQERWEETPREGIAIEDKSSASLVNLATLGVGNATGLGWSGYFNGSGNMDQTFHFVLGGFAYNFRDFNGKNNHELGLGFSPYQGMYLGAGIRWDTGSQVGFNAHLLYRPWNWMSVGIKGESLNNQPWMDWGVGFRPLAFSNGWGNRLSLFYDGRISSTGRYQNLSTGLRIEPIDGIEIYGHWNFLEDKFVSGVNLSWNRLLVGGEATVGGNDAWQEGNVQVFASFKEMRSLSVHRNRLVIYDTAQIVTDVPRLYASAMDMRRKPSPVKSLYEFLMDMEELIRQPDVKAVLFDSQAFSTSFSNILEVEQVLIRLKEAGKKVYFYADTLGSSQYSLAASVADGIIMSPQGSVDLTGFGITNLYLKDLMARYGVNVTNFRSHEYKTAYDQLSESEMSAAQRQTLTTVYGALQDEMDRMIEEGRVGKLKSELEHLYTEGYWMSASRALEVGLIDEVMYRDRLNVWLGLQRYQVTRFSNYRWEMEYDWAAANRPNIALIYANGNINMGTGQQGSNIGAESLAAAIRNARRNPLISAIVLRINSGGGSALASDIIAREVALCATGTRPKPVIISMGGMAASGGYMIAAPGTRILATPGTITGSIGVIAMIPDISGLLEMLEVGVNTITTTESADVPNIYRPLTKTEEQRIRDSIMHNYDSFIDLVAYNRDMSSESVDEIAQGKIWSGRQAVENGLADTIGGLSDALLLAKETAGVPNARVLEINPGNVGMIFPGIPNPLAAFLGLEKPEPLEYLPDDLAEIIEFYQMLSAYEQGESLYLMPFTSSEIGVE